MLKKIISGTLGKLGYSKTQTNHVVEGVEIKDEVFRRIYEQCKPFTMTSFERMFGLYSAVKYVVDAKIDGHFVECGVWKGGSSMMIALTLKSLGVTDKKIYLYDTFEGMSEPSAEDVSFDSQSAASQLESSSKQDQDSVWCYAPIDQVSENIRLTGYPLENVIMVKGMVEHTINESSNKDGIALLRLDTDWYESTRHELVHLFPKLSKNGPLIIDDYGHWEGCRKAVDEYFSQHNVAILLSRVDYTGRMGVKI